jgi:hypothetical protein
VSGLMHVDDNARDEADDHPVYLCGTHRAEYEDARSSEAAMLTFVGHINAPTG